MASAAENDGFLGGSKPIKVAEGERGDSRGCLRSRGCLVCALVTGFIGILCIVMGFVMIFLGEGIIERKVLESMALTPGSDRTESWLRPPVQPHLYGYAFHVTNPDAILRGNKPIVEERGPYVYKSVTVKDSDDNMVWNDDDGTLTYRPRKFYTYEPSLSGEGLDPKKDMIMVPNIPLWTGLNKIKDKGFGKEEARDLVVTNGRGTPFINVTFDGLLWGYEDDLPCVGKGLDLPSECEQDGDNVFGKSTFDDFGDDSDWVSWGEVEEDEKKEKWKSPDEDPESEFYGQAKPKQEYVDCKCNWGLFRDRNVTMRKPVRFLTGTTDLSRKGIVTEYDGKKELDWWKKGSHCDAVGGQDSSTMPPGLTNQSTPDVFIALMCRSLPMVFEKVREFFVSSGGVHGDRCTISSLAHASSWLWQNWKLVNFQNRKFLLTLEHCFFEQHQKKISK